MTRSPPTDDEARAAHRLLDATPDGLVVVDRAGLIRYVNVQTERLFGRPREALLGQPLSTLLPERFRRDHDAHLARYFAAPKLRPMGVRMDLWGLRADGTEFPVEVSLSPFEDAQGSGVCAAVRDVSERKALEAGVRLYSDRLASTIESVEDAVALFDAADRLVLCNSAYRRLVGETARGPLVGRAWPDILEAWLPHLVFVTDEERTQFRADRLAERTEPRRAFAVKTVDGASLRVTNRRTGEGGVVQTLWDLSDEVAAAEALRAARHAAETASAAKSEFLASMSHELRTPLNAILGFAQLLDRDKKAPLSDRHRGRIEHILKGGEHLLTLIDEVLDLSRIEAGRVSVSPEPVRVAEVMAEVQQTLSLLAARADVALAVAPGLDEALTVVADRTRFRQILLNYGSNAVKYGRAGGHATFRAEALDDCVRVTVTDDGVGVPVEHQARLFQPFHRAGQETGSIEGTGIGLAITRRLAELMHGRVGFSSVPGEGSTFWLELPRHRGAAAAASSTSGVRAGAGRAAPLDAAGERALVVYVEDNPSNIAFMRDLLADFDGVELVTAHTAELALELMRAQRPRVVIMDINLPGMSGFEATRRMQADPATRDVPVIALSAATPLRDGHRTKEAGFYRSLTKPVQVDALVQALQAVLRGEPPTPAR